MGKIKIDLPKKNEEGKSYLSYSQYNKWKNGKRDYIRSYFFKEPWDGNAYTSFGSLVGEALENGDFSAFEPEEAATLKKCTRLDQFEREISYDFGDFFVKGFIDTNDLHTETHPEGSKDDTFEFVRNLIDYKTGAPDKASLYEGDGYEQVTIYAGALRQETGVLPERGWVELIERTGNPFKQEELKVGGSVTRIPQDVSPGAILKVEQNLKKVAKDISAHYKIFKMLNVPIAEED